MLLLPPSPPSTPSVLNSKYQLFGMYFIHDHCEAERLTPQSANQTAWQPFEAPSTGMGSIGVHGNKNPLHLQGQRSKQAYGLLLSANDQAKLDKSDRPPFRFAKKD